MSVQKSLPDSDRRTGASSSSKTGTSRSQPQPQPQKLSEILDGIAKEQVDAWAKENYTKLWLGGPGRKQVQADIAKLLRRSYDLAKERYGGNT